MHSDEDQNGGWYSNKIYQVIDHSISISARFSESIGGIGGSHFSGAAAIIFRVCIFNPVQALPGQAETVQPPNIDFADMEE